MTQKKRQLFVARCGVQIEEEIENSFPVIRSILNPKQIEKSNFEHRVHCLKYGKYFTLKHNCLECNNLFTFIQRGGIND